MLLFYLTFIEDSAQKQKFETIYQTYRGMMYRVSLSVTKDKDLAEDAVHEAFVQIINEIDTIRTDNEKELSTYLYIITKNRAVDFLRKWERQKVSLYPADELPSGDENIEPEEIALTNINLENVLLILTQMPEIYRTALTMRVKGYSVKEIAVATKTTESNVKSRIHRARKILIREFCKDNN